VRPAAMIEDLMGTVRRHPHFRLSDVLEPYAEETLTRLKTAEIWGRRLARGTAEAAALSAELPSGLRRILGLLERGDLEVSLKHDELSHALSSLNGMLRRLTAAVLVGAAIVAGATLRGRGDRGHGKSADSS